MVEMNRDNIIKQIDKNISELVYEKTKLVKAYNYYHGIMDSEQYKHLEENYGLGVPTSIEFVPLVRKHINVLVGEYISAPLMARVSCKDSETLSKINREKQIAIAQEVVSELKDHLEKTTYAALKGEKVQDIEILQRIKQRMEEIDRNFISNYEIAGQNIIDYIDQSKNIDFKLKRILILLDLLISGTCYFRTLPSPSKTNMEFKVLNPLSTFVDRNSKSPYLKKSSRAVSIEYLTKQQILSEYGDLLNEDDLDSLDNLENFGDSLPSYVRTYQQSVSDSGTTEYDGILGGYEITPLLPYARFYQKGFKVYPVYFTEWLHTEKENGEFITNRYEGIRIGETIYIPTGKSKDVVRSMDNPKDCTLSIDGMFYSDRNGDPISLILSTANLQDKFNILHFYRDNLLAESGSSGDWLDVAHLPKFLGSNVTERLMKWKAYKKQGLALFDSSQEGEVINTTFQGYDDTIKAQAIEAIEIAIERTENTCSGITGVFREKIGGIEQRDAVTNVEVGIRNSSYITKQYYQTMDVITRESLVDLINVAKIVYKNGITGTLVLGEGLNKIFTALPEHYTFTDFDIHIKDSSEVIREEETIKQLSMEFAKGGHVEPDLILQTVSAKGLTKLKEEVAKSLKQKREDQTQQLTEQLEQYDKQLKELQKSNEQLSRKIQQLNEEKLNLERKKLQSESELEWFKAKSEEEYMDKKIELDKKRVELEALQLVDDNPKNDEIRNN